MNRKKIEESLTRPVRAAARAPAAPVTAPVAPARADRKHRLTIDLISPEYRDFATWRDGAADQLGRARITAQDTVRLLVRRLLADEKLQRDLIAELRRENGAE